MAAEIASGFWAAERHLTKRSLTDAEILHIIGTLTLQQFRRTIMKT